MDTAEWKNRSIQTESEITPASVMAYHTLIGLQNADVEPGDRLAPYSHWFSFRFDDEEFLSLTNRESPAVYAWYEGTLETDLALLAGDHVRCQLRIVSVEELSRPEGGALITLKRTVLSGGKPVVEEQLQLIRFDPASDYSEIRRLHFDPDWEHEVTLSQSRPLQMLQPAINGHAVQGIISSQEIGNGDALRVEGPPELLLLLDSFDYHFDSREAVKISWKASGFSSCEPPYRIAGKDVDSYDTELSILNSKRQVLFTASVRWHSTWETRRY